MRMKLFDTLFMNIISMSFLIFYSISAMSASTVQSASKAGQHPLTCTGNFGQSGLLKNVGFTEEELKKGIPCEVSDFDGNGSQDFWFTKCDASLKCPADEQGRCDQGNFCST